MKRLIVASLIAVVFSSCVVETIEPRYDPRDKLVGYYDVEEYSETYNDVTHYSIHISKSGYDNEIHLNNFYAVELSVYAIVNNDRITIPYQVTDGYQIEGVGTIYGNELRLSYSVKDRYNNSRTDFCETKAWFDY